MTTSPFSPFGDQSNQIKTNVKKQPYERKLPLKSLVITKKKIFSLSILQFFLPLMIIQKIKKQETFYRITQKIKIEHEVLSHLEKLKKKYLDLTL